jgi:hypothetical protein
LVGAAQPASLDDRPAVRQLCVMINLLRTGILLAALTAAA